MRTRHRYSEVEFAPHLHLVEAPTDTRPRGMPFTGPHLLDTAVLYTAADRSRREGPLTDLLEDHLDRYGERPRMVGHEAERLLGQVEAVNLTGRGGAHFPVARKWRTVLDSGGGGLVVANGAEGEPASAKDAALLQHRPHLVLDGMAVTAEVLGAVRAVIWLHTGDALTLRCIHRAIAERRTAGVQDPPTTVVTGPDHYLTGESSAVVQGLSGGPVLPAFRRLPAARKGVDGLPTLVQNVETLARVALVARFGEQTLQPGPMVTVVGDDTLAVAELPVHLTLGQAASVGPPRRPSVDVPPQAVLVGGYGGRWMPWTQAVDVPLAHLDGVAAPSLGAGVLAVAGQDVCGITETAAVVDYLARSSARQCGPCANGTRELAEVLLRIARGRQRRNEARRVSALAGEIRGRGACGLPDGAVQLALSALEAFPSDVEAHLAGHPCGFSGYRSLLPVPGRRAEPVR